MSVRVSTRALVAHHLRSRTGAVAVVAALVAVLSLIGALAPLALGVLADASLRDRLAGIPATERDVLSTSTGMPQLSDALDDSWPRFLTTLEGIRDDAAAGVPELLGDPQAITRTGVEPAFGTRKMSLAFAPGYDEQVRFTAGRAPEPLAAISDWTGFYEDPVLVEVALSEKSAQEFGWAVGETWSPGLGSGGAVTYVLTGTFVAADPDDDYWQHVPSVLTPQIDDDGNRPRGVIATAFAHPDSLVLASRSSTQLTDAWYPLDAGAITAADAAAVAAGLRELTAVSHTVGTSSSGYGILGVRFEADITGPIDVALAQQAATTALLAMLVSGPVGVAAAVLVLGCRLVLESRRPALRLLSARGASLGQLRGLLAVEAVIVGVVPAVLGGIAGLVLGAVWAGGMPTAAALTAGLVPVVLLAVAPLVILVALAPGAAERRPRADLGRAAGRARVIAEVALCVVTAVAVALLFVRGYSGGVDLLLAATPLLVALTACLLTLRLYPLPLRAIWRRGRAASGLDTFLGAARALREPAIGLTPVLALTVGVSVAVTAGVLLSVLQFGTAEAARAEVGADLRVTGASFSPTQLDEVRSVPGVAAAAGVSGLVPATLDVSGVRSATSVFVVDGAVLRDVQGDGPGLLPPEGTVAGSDPAAIIVSGAVADTVDGEADLRLEGVDVTVAGITRGPVPIGARADWVLVDQSVADGILGRDPSDRVLLVRVDDDADPAAVTAQLRDLLGDTVRIDTADAVRERLAEGPAAQGVRTVLLASTALAAVLGALALAMTLTLAAGPRARTAALLRILGAPRRSAGRLALWEVGPPVLAALVTGTVFGALVPLVMMAAVDLRAFTGSSLAPAYRIDPLVVALTLGGFVLMAAVSTALSLLVSRRVRAAGALRTVEEG